MDKLLTPQEEKKAKIFEAAIQIVSEKGYEKATISQIAKVADVATGTVYEYYKNKEDLFLSIAEEHYAMFHEELRIHLSGIKSSFEKIRKYIWFYFYFFQKDSLYSEIWLLVLRLKKNLTHYPWVQLSGEVILDLFREGQKENVIKTNIDLYVMRHLLIGSLEHAMTRWLVKNKTYDMLAYSEKISDLIIDAIKTNE